MSAPIVDKTSPLVFKRNVPFYDADIILNIQRSLGEAYIILLSGGPIVDSALDSDGRVKSQRNGEDDGAITLGFLAVIEGNVVDTCFGVNIVQDKLSPVAKQVKEVKELLGTAVAKNEDIRRVAVQTYRRAFEIVLRYQSKLAQLNFFTRCFRYGGIVKQAREDLKTVFAELVLAVRQATPQRSYR
jgi:hypothetical protein